VAVSGLTFGGVPAWRYRISHDPGDVSHGDLGKMTPEVLSDGVDLGRVYEALQASSY